MTYIPLLYAQRTLRDGFSCIYFNKRKSSYVNGYINLWNPERGRHIAFLRDERNPPKDTKYLRLMKSNSEKFVRFLATPANLLVPAVETIALPNTRIEGPHSESDPNKLRHVEAFQPKTPTAEKYIAISLRATFRTIAPSPNRNVYTNSHLGIYAMRDATRVHDQLSSVIF